MLRCWRREVAKVDGDGGLALDRSDLAEVSKVRKAREVRSQLESAFGKDRFEDLGGGKWDLALNGQSEVQTAAEIMRPANRIAADRGENLRAAIPTVPMRIDGRLEQVDARFEQQAHANGARRAFHGRARISPALAPKHMKLPCGHWRWLDDTHTDNLCPYGCS